MSQYLPVGLEETIAFWPFVRKFVFLFQVAGRTSNAHVIRPVGATTRQRDNVVVMMPFPCYFLLAPITLAFLPFVLIQHVLSGVCTWSIQLQCAPSIVSLFEKYSGFRMLIVRLAHEPIALTYLWLLVSRSLLRAQAFLVVASVVGTVDLLVCLVFFLDIKSVIINSSIRFIAFLYFRTAMVLLLISSFMLLAFLCLAVNFFSCFSFGTSFQLGVIYSKALFYIRTTIILFGIGLLAFQYFGIVTTLFHVSTLTGLAPTKKAVLGIAGTIKKLSVCGELFGAFLAQLCVRGYTVHTVEPPIQSSCQRVLAHRSGTTLLPPHFTINSPFGQLEEVFV